MAARVSMVDIAREIGVSRATVSYVLNDPDTEMVGQAMRERVLVAARKMGYRPNRAAQALKGRPSHLIELFVPGYFAPFYAWALREFKHQLDSTPYQLQIVDPSHWTDEEGDADSGWPMDGIITFDSLLPVKVIEFLKERRTPFVWVGSSGNADFTADFDHVLVDLSQAALEANQHLVGRGGRVAYLSHWTAEQLATFKDRRYPAYRAAMQEANLPEEIIVTSWGVGMRAATRQTVRDYVRENGCPSAFFCFNDEMAVATLAAMRDLNIRVPQDVWIIGSDGIEETLYHAPQLSTIEYPMAKAARLAWLFLQHRIENPDAPVQSATITAKLALRESSAP